MQDLRIQRVKVLMMLYTSHYFVNNRQKQLLDHSYALSRDQAFDYMTEFNKRLSDKVGIKCTMDVLLPTDDDNANIIIEYNGIIKKLMKEAEKLELDTDAIKEMMRDLLNELKDDIDLGEGETTVLQQMSYNNITPYLVRSRTNALIPIEKTEFLVGKSSECDYQIPDNRKVSRKHCSFRISNGECYIRDENSTNHTYVNGKMIQPGLI